MKIIHLSDMHFGTQTQGIVENLLKAVKSISADLIVITGDFTQRALNKQYLQVKEFLSQLDNTKLLCVPGNHDISLHNVWERMLYPFAKYSHYISPNLNPCFRNNSINILGINSVTPYRIKDGYITQEQLDKVKEYFSDPNKSEIRIVVMHHNLIKSDKHRIILNAQHLLHTLAECKVNMVLSGHLHYACVEPIQNEFINYPLFIVTAGTATSRRIRTQQNSFNVIEVNQEQFTLTVKEYQNSQFVTGMEATFQFYP